MTDHERTAIKDDERTRRQRHTLLTELEAASVGVQVVVGQQLGLYRELGASAGLTSAELAERTRTSERYIRVWLESQTDAGYLEYDPQADTYSLTPEQAAVFTNDDSPVHCDLDAIYDGGPCFVEVLETFLYIHRNLSDEAATCRRKTGYRKPIPALGAS